MGAKAKKAWKNKLRKISTQLPVSSNKESPGFLPIEGGPPRKLPQQKPLENCDTVIDIGRIPHGFDAMEMEGKSKHFGFMKFEAPGVAEIVADCMHNYLLFEHLLQVHVIPPEHVHPKILRGYNFNRTPLNKGQIEQKRQNKERTLDKCKKLADNTLKRRGGIEAASIEYKCPEIVGHIQPSPKKIKFDDE